MFKFLRQENLPMFMLLQTITVLDTHETKSV